MSIGDFAGSLSDIASRWLPALVDASIKGAVVLAIAAVASQAMRRTSAAARQFVWFLALASLLALPILSACLPAWQVLPKWARMDVAVVPAGAEAMAPAANDAKTPVGQQPPDALAEVSPGVVAPPLPAEMASGQPAPDAAATAAPMPPADPEPAAAKMSRQPTWLSTALPWAAGVWLLGTFICVAILLLARVSLWRLQRISKPLVGGSWGVLLGRAMNTLKLNRPVTLLQSDQRTMPMVWGVFRSMLLLPAEADDWPAERRWVVILHELAHAKRWDYLTKLIAQWACALYWFNPLAWWAFKQFQREAEQASDDLVVASGQEAADYAEHLLCIATGLKANRLACQSSIAFARPSKLEGRLLAILNPARSRRRLTWGLTILAASLLASVLVPLAMLRAASKDANTPPDPVWTQEVKPSGWDLGRIVHFGETSQPVAWKFSKPVPGDGTVNPHATIAKAGQIAVAIDSSKPDVALPDLIRLDLTGRGQFDDKSVLPLRAQWDGSSLIATFGSAKVQLQKDDAAIPATLYGSYRVFFAKPGGWEPLPVPSRELHIQMTTAVESVMDIAGAKWIVRLIDATSNLKVDDPAKPGKGVEFTPGDTVQVELADGQIVKGYYGHPLQVDGKWYDIRLSPDGKKIEVQPSKAAIGKLAVDQPYWMCLLVGKKHVVRPESTTAGLQEVPVDEYQLVKYQVSPASTTFTPFKTFIIGAFGAGQSVEIRTGRVSELKLGAPLMVSIDTRKVGDVIEFNLNLKDKDGGKLWWLTLDGGRRPPEPKVTVIDSEGTTIYTATLKYDQSMYTSCSHSWRVPKGLKGTFLVKTQYEAESVDIRPDTAFTLP